jgi:hypothetical protein
MLMTCVVLITKADDGVGAIPVGIRGESAAS